MSKLERRNKARQIQANKHRDLLRDQKIFDGRKGAARIVAVISLCEDVESTAAVRCLNRALDIEGEVPADGMMAVSYVSGSLSKNLRRAKTKTPCVIG